MILAIGDAFLVLLLISSIREKEKRAVFISFPAIILNSALWVCLNLFNHLAWIRGLNTGLWIIGGAMVLLSLFKWSPSFPLRDMSAAQQYDERDYMFSRNNLKFHPDLAEKYYAAHPEKRAIDEKIHAKPEIGEPGQVYYDDYYSPVFDAAFGYLARTRGAASGEPAPEKKEIDAETIIRVISGTARYYGAVDVGFARVRKYHFYSHSGRRAENWGKAIDAGHRTAVVIIVAMDVEMLKAAPALPVILESSRQYVESAKIANVIAAYIRSFGYAARAHTDGNYQVMCVPAAVDAGLGELGRLGLFMHPVYGPCVRISVVTTELELTGTEQKVHPASASINHFCKICKKCADNCPTQSICEDEEHSSRGFRHWSINQETCFSYWKHTGTDCALCIGVCPYTKPDTLVHKLVRFYISRNAVNRKIALLMDDLFYGRKKKIKNKNQEPFLRKKVPGPPKTFN
jgi:reductive dehalogenase